MKDKANIIAMKNGVPQGFVQSVSYIKNSFTLTRDKSKAKGYSSVDKVQKEIDFLTLVGNQDGYVFIYN